LLSGSDQLLKAGLTERETAILSRFYFDRQRVEFIADDMELSLSTIEKCKASGIRKLELIGLRLNRRPRPDVSLMAFDEMDERFTDDDRYNAG
jgi:DNA-binding NarL/FixJ family response regulator